jgi:enoyl-CoA hydratase/carnithine racemase
MTQVVRNPIVTAHQGHVAVVTLDQPPHNYLSMDSMHALADALAAADADPNVRAMVVQSEGGTFSAGANLASAETSSSTPAPKSEGLNPFYADVLRLFKLAKPFVAAVQGPAVGAGLGLALAADFRVAAPEARFAANFVKLGFHPGYGLTAFLPRLIGEQKAALMLLTGRRIKGEEAVAWGLADELVPAGELRAAALRLAAEIAEAAPLAVIATRRTLRQGLAEAVEARLHLEFREQMALRATEDYQEGVRAVAERRPGNFKGR